MIVCPKCGAEYTVNPEKCAVCGAELEEHSVPDLFASALAQEKSAENKRREIREQFQRMRTAKPESETKQPEAAADDETAETVPEQPAYQKKNSRGMKIAAGLTAAVLLTGTAVYAWNGDKPSGFVRSNTAAVYLKDKSLWIFNGQDGKTMCLHDDAIPDTVFNQRGMQAAEILKDMVHFSTDGETVYYPVFREDTSDPENADSEAGTWEVVDYMCRSFEDPVTETKVAEINTLYLYGSDEDFESQQRNNSLNSGPLIHPTDQPRSEYGMDVPLLFCGDTLYYRNADGAFCCTENGETTVISPGVQRFWQVPGTEGIFYLMSNVDALSEDDLSVFSSDPGKAHSTTLSKSWVAAVTHVYDGLFFEQDMNSYIADNSVPYAPFRLYHRMPGAEPDEIVMTDGDTESIVTRFYPLNRECPQYLYYTMRAADKRRELRRINVTTGITEIIMNAEKLEQFTESSDIDSTKLSYLVSTVYPDGSCYFLTVLYGDYNFSLAGQGDDNSRYSIALDDGNVIVQDAEYPEDSIRRAAEQAIYIMDSYERTLFFYDPKTSPDPQKLTKVQMATYPYVAVASEAPYAAVHWGSNSTIRFYHGAEKIESEAKEAWPYFAGMQISPLGSLFFGATMFRYSSDFYTSSSPAWEPDYCEIRLTPQKAKKADRGEAEQYFEINPEKPEQLWLKKPLVDSTHNGDCILSNDNGDLDGRVSPGSCRYSPKRDALYFVQETEKPASLAADKRKTLGRSSYYGTLERYQNGQKKVISEAVSDFYPFADGEDDLLYLISNTDSQTGALCFMSEKKRYCADYHATRLLAVLPVPVKE